MTGTTKTQCTIWNSNAPKRLNPRIAYNNFSPVAYEQVLHTSVDQINMISSFDPVICYLF